ncbi:MAG: SHOCT domain-containing protein [Leptospiraceae bacterium]|nr:SHOCT domain-containing protein [Leptospiraceae bacterium]MCP5511283.1 SHOCT domain-containing protein [Leptospiraceae bacterium]
MQPLTEQGQKQVQDIANRHFVSYDAAITLLQALVNGQGTMAQFSHPELGGSGQWMLGGMTMVGDMFNSSLKAKVEGLCYDLSNLLASQPFRPAPTSFQSQNQGGGQQQQQGGGYGMQSNPNQYPAVSLFIPGSSAGWWPADLGNPSSTGSQNNVRYAYFPDTHRLAIEINGEISIYDTQNHQIGGVSQQQGSGGSILFTSQFGTVDVLNLPIISGKGTLRAPQMDSNPTQNFQNQTSPEEEDIFLKIEKLAELKAKGIISEEEFQEKKTNLLNRL